MILTVVKSIVYYVVLENYYTTEVILYPKWMSTILLLLAKQLYLDCLNLEGIWKVKLSDQNWLIFVNLLTSKGGKWAQKTAYRGKWVRDRNLILNLSFIFANRLRVPWDEHTVPPRGRHPHRSVYYRGDLRYLGHRYVLRAVGTTRRPHKDHAVLHQCSNMPKRWQTVT